MPTRRFKSKEQQRIESKLGVASSWGFTVKRDRSSVFSAEEAANLRGPDSRRWKEERPGTLDKRPVMLDGNRYPTGWQMSGVHVPLAVIGRVKSYAGKARFDSKPKPQPPENLPLSAKGINDDLRANKGIGLKNTYARLLSIFPENRTGYPVGKGTGKRRDGVVEASQEPPSSAVAPQSFGQPKGSAGEDRPQAKSQQPAKPAR